MLARAGAFSRKSHLFTHRTRSGRLRDLPEQCSDAGRSQNKYQRLDAGIPVGANPTPGSQYRHEQERRCAVKGSTVNNVGSIIRRDETDEAIFDLRFKGIEHYHHYTSIKEFIRDWRDYDEYVDQEIAPLEKPKSEARRRIDLFLRRIKNIPTDKAGFDAWKANEGIYKKEGK